MKNKRTSIFTTIIAAALASSFSIAKGYYATTHFTYAKTVNPPGSKRLRSFYRAQHGRRGTYKEARDWYAGVSQAPHLMGSRAEHEARRKA